MSTSWLPDEYPADPGRRFEPVTSLLESVAVAGRTLEALGAILGSGVDGRRRLAKMIFDDAIDALATAATRLDIVRVRHPRLAETNDSRILEGWIADSSTRLRQAFLELDPQAVAGLPGPR